MFQPNPQHPHLQRPPPTSTHPFISLSKPPQHPINIHVPSELSSFAQSGQTHCQSLPRHTLCQRPAPGFYSSCSTQLVTSLLHQPALRKQLHTSCNRPAKRYSNPGSTHSRKHMQVTHPTRSVSGPEGRQVMHSRIHKLNHTHAPAHLASCACRRPGAPLGLGCLSASPWR